MSVTHERISPTAKMVAYWRQFSDIPFAAEVGEIIGAQQVAEEILTERNLSAAGLQLMAPILEARYKCLNGAIRRLGASQVLEIASGVALRGLSLTEDPNITYVETDLPGMTLEKSQVAEEVCKRQGISERKNLHFRSANMLSEKDMDQAVEPFNPEKPLLVIHEGLFQYFSMEEKELAARNVFRLLSRFGGAWVTPDFVTKDDIDKSGAVHPEMAKMREAVGRLTDRDFRGSAFDNPSHIISFFHELGFEFGCRPQLDGSFGLSSLERLSIPPAVIDRYGASLKVWTMKRIEEG